MRGTHHPLLAAAAVFAAVVGSYFAVDLSAHGDSAGDRAPAASLVGAVLTAPLARR